MDFRGIVDQMFAVGEQDAKKRSGWWFSGGVRTTNIHCPPYWKRQPSKEGSLPLFPRGCQRKGGRKEVDISAEGKREGDGGERGRKKAL